MGIETLGFEAFSRSPEPAEFPSADKEVREKEGYGPQSHNDHHTENYDMRKTSPVGTEYSVIGGEETQFDET